MANWIKKKVPSTVPVPVIDLNDPRMFMARWVRPSSQPGWMYCSKCGEKIGNWWLCEKCQAVACSRCSSGRCKQCGD